ncbi:MAG: transcriptional activator NhaR [Vicinamibacterales bacterium]
MDWLNYHHLYYFWTVVREGGLVPASRVLRLAHPTISAQLRQLEASLGEPLFDRSRRRLELTETGRTVFGYADEIFAVGRELMDVVRHRPTGRPLRLAVGVTDVMPKLVVRELLQPAFRLGQDVVVSCREDRHDRVLAALALHELDVVLADAPVPPGSAIRAFNHLLGECGVTFFAGRALAPRLRRGFPGCLDGAPFLVPTGSSALRRSLDQWLAEQRLRPAIVAEFDDSALLGVFGQDGLGVFCAPTVLEGAVRRQHDARVLGRTDAIVERFYAISGERRLTHPAVAAISQAARDGLFVTAPPAGARRRSRSRRAGAGSGRH